MNYYQTQSCPSELYSQNNPGRCIKTKIVECINNVCRISEVGYDDKIELYIEDRRNLFQKIKDSSLFKVSIFLIKILNLPFVIIAEIIDLAKNKKFN